MPNIFVSYRRDDSSAIAGWIRDKLSGRYENSVFRDIDNIAIAENFRSAIGRALRHCDVVIAIIGPKWLGPRDDGTRRIDEDRDWVRVELAMALHLGIPVIPVLVERARMPRPSEVPEEIRDVTELNALVVEPGPDFQNQINRLTESIDRVPINTSLPPPVPVSTTDLREVRPQKSTGLEETRPEKTKFAALLAFGKYKIAFSITTACLALVFVYAVWHEELQPQLDVAPDFGRFLADPRSQSRTTIIALQQALCVPDSELGVDGPLTLEMAKIYKDTDRPVRDGTQLEQKLTMRDVQKLLSAGPCQRDKFRNYFEREAFPKTIASPELIRLLNRSSAGGPLSADATKSAVRNKIMQVRRSLGLNNIPDAMADQVTRDLVDRLAQLPAP